MNNSWAAPTRVLSSKAEILAANRARLRTFGKQPSVAGLGASGTAASASAGASTGATVGSAVPVIGTAIGAVVGAIIGAGVSLLKGKVGKSEGTWEAYKPGIGKALGREYEEISIIEAIRGMFVTNQNRFGPKDKMDYWLTDMAAEIVKAIKSGAASPSWSAAEMFSKIVKPWATSTGRYKSPHAHTDGLLIDTIDRYLNNMPITRANTSEATRTALKITYNAPAAPLILDALGLSTPPVQVATPAAPLPIPPPAALPPGALSVNDVTQAVRDIVASIQASPAAANLSPQQISDAAAATAFKWLQGQGVPTSNASVQAAVQSEVARFDWMRYAIPAGIATAAGLTLYLIFRRRRGRAATRS